MAIDFDEQFLTLLHQAVVRLGSELESCAFLKSQVWPWIAKLGGPDRDPEAYFLHAQSTPVFLFPWWLEKSLCGTPDAEFQLAVMYSTLNLCYYVRIVDDVMDRHANTGRSIPAISFFHSRYQGAYAPYFASTDPFWNFFFRLNDESCEVTAHDASLKDISLLEFRNITARKICAALVAVAAVASRYHRPDVFETWAEFWYTFGCWTQMRNDLFDWQRDLDCGVETYLLSEAKRRKRPDEQIAAWLIREGYDWATERLRGFGCEARKLAARLGSADLEGYLQHRVEETSDQLGRLSHALAAVGTIRH